MFLTTGASRLLGIAATELVALSPAPVEPGGTDEEGGRVGEEGTPLGKRRCSRDSMVSKPVPAYTLLLCCALPRFGMLGSQRLLHEATSCE